LAHDQLVNSSLCQLDILSTELRHEANASFP
jgi:hypothetical protein